MVFHYMVRHLLRLSDESPLELALLQRGLVDPSSILALQEEEIQTLTYKHANGEQIDVQYYFKSGVYLLQQYTKVQAILERPVTDWLKVTQADMDMFRIGPNYQQFCMIYIPPVQKHTPDPVSDESAVESTPVPVIPPCDAASHDPPALVLSPPPAMGSAIDPDDTSLDARLISYHGDFERKESGRIYMARLGMGFCFTLIAVLYLFTQREIASPSIALNPHSTDDVLPAMMGSMRPFSSEPNWDAIREYYARPTARLGDRSLCQHFHSFHDGCQFCLDVRFSNTEAVVPAFFANNSPTLTASSSWRTEPHVHHHCQPLDVPYTILTPIFDLIARSPSDDDPYSLHSYASWELPTYPVLLPSCDYEQKGSDRIHTVLLAVRISFTLITLTCLLFWYNGFWNQDLTCGK